MRPTNRPVTPYTQQEIINGVYQHFVVERNTRCTADGGDYCIYGKTGCAVGCLLTIEDASEIDSKSDAISIGKVKAHSRGIYDAYFLYGVLPLLIDLQNLHDSCFFTTKQFAVTLSEICKSFNLNYPGDIKIDSEIA